MVQSPPPRIISNTSYGDSGKALILLSLAPLSLNGKLNIREEINKSCRDTYNDDYESMHLNALQGVQHRLQPPGKTDGLYRRNRERLRRACQEGILADAAGRRLPDERRHHEARGGMRLQAPLESARRHCRVHEVVQERQESTEVGLLLDAGHKMPAGSPTRPREIFFKKIRRGY